MQPITAGEKNLLKLIKELNQINSTDVGVQDIEIVILPPPGYVEIQETNNKVILNNGQNQEYLNIRKGFFEAISQTKDFNADKRHLLKNLLDHYQECLQCLNSESDLSKFKEFTKAKKIHRGIAYAAQNLFCVDIKNTDWHKKYINHNTIYKRNLVVFGRVNQGLKVLRGHIDILKNEYLRS